MTYQTPDYITTYRKLLDTAETGETKGDNSLNDAFLLSRERTLTVRTEPYALKQGGRKAHLTVNEYRDAELQGQLFITINNLLAIANGADAVLDRTDGDWFYIFATERQPFGLKITRYRCVLSRRNLDPDDRRYYNMPVLLDGQKYAGHQDGHGVYITKEELERFKRRMLTVPQEGENEAV